MEDWGDGVDADKADEVGRVGVVISHSLLSHGGRHGPAPIFSFLSRLQPYLDNTHVHHFQQVMSPDQRFIQNHCKNNLTANNLDPQLLSTTNLPIAQHG